ncbi:MAG TPA: SEL1-like repeat protein, partial [Aestuariivirgaceae bacterium]
MYRLGLGVERDTARAKVHWEDAAALGNIFAKKFLGLLLIRTHLNTAELIRGVLLVARALSVDLFVVLCREGIDSDKARE